MATTMMGWRHAPKIVTCLRPSTYPDLRTYRVFASRGGYTTEVKDWKHQSLFSKDLLSVNHRCYVPALNILKTFASKSSEGVSKQSEEEVKHEPEHQEEHQPEPESEDPIKIVYVLPHIKPARNITKLKIFQTAVVVVAFPIVYEAYLTGSVAKLTIMSTAFITSFSTVMLYVIGSIISKAVCLMKYNSKTDEVIISHLNFWGRRRDVTIPVSNIIPISDSSENMTDTYIKVNTYDNSESFVLYLKWVSKQQKENVLSLIG